MPVCIQVEVHGRSAGAVLVRLLRLGLLLCEHKGELCPKVFPPHYLQVVYLCVEMSMAQSPA